MLYEKILFQSFYLKVSCFIVHILATVIFGLLSWVGFKILFHQFDGTDILDENKMWTELKDYTFVELLSRLIKLVHHCWILQHRPWYWPELFNNWWTLDSYWTKLNQHWTDLNNNIIVFLGLLYSWIEFYLNQVCS